MYSLENEVNNKTEKCLGSQLVTSFKTWKHTTAREPTCELKNTLHIFDYYFSENKTETETS